MVSLLPGYYLYAVTCIRLRRRLLYTCPGIDIMVRTARNGFRCTLTMSSRLSAFILGDNAPGDNSPRRQPPTENTAGDNPLLDSGSLP